MAKLMLVEDDNNLREIYEARLQAEGYDIVSAKDGEEALAVAKAEKPDLVISDIMMPKISGFEMLDILRNTDGLKNIRIIMLTALGQSDDQQRANKLGADKYLVKSQVTLEDIVRVTHELLEDEPAPVASNTAPASSVNNEVPSAQALPPAEPAQAPVAPLAPPVEPPEAPQPAAADMPAPVPVAPPTTADTPDPTAAQDSQAAQPEPTTPPVQSATEEPVTVTTATPVDIPSEDPTVDAPETPEEEPQPEATPDPETPAPSTPPLEEGSQEDAQTTSEEKATVEAEIEDFVEGASTDAPPPDPNAPAMEPDTENPAEDNTSPSEADTAADDQLMSDTVDKLNEDKKNEKDPETVIVTPTVDPASAPAEDKAEDLNSVPDSPARNNVTIAHKKVISPIDHNDKPDIQTLYALEQARVDAAAPPPPPTAVIADGESGVKKQPLGSNNTTSASGPQTPHADPGTDPSSIAL